MFIGFSYPLLPSGGGGNKGLKIKEMEIKFIKSPVGIGYSYSAGNTAELPDALAKEFIEMGYAEEVQPRASVVNPPAVEDAADHKHEQAEKSVIKKVKK